jgi:hypothetical protein
MTRLTKALVLGATAAALAAPAAGANYLPGTTDFPSGNRTEQFVPGVSDFPQTGYHIVSPATASKTVRAPVVAGDGFAWAAAGIGAGAALLIVLAVGSALALRAAGPGRLGPKLDS